MALNFAINRLTVIPYQPTVIDRKISLSWSDDGGASYAFPLVQSTGELGKFETNVQFRRLGYARNRVIRLFWSGSVPTALLGVFVEAEVAET